MLQPNDFLSSFISFLTYLEARGYSQAIIARFSHLSAHQFSFRMPRYYADLIHWDNPNDPLLLSVMYSEKENTIQSYEHVDPIGDKPFSPVPGIIHRYKNRCLLMLTNACAIHCRYCFRKNLLDNDSAKYEESMLYIADHQEIEEVILSGGDPLSLTDYFLENIFLRLNAIPHVGKIRIHTKTPIVYPTRITQSLIDILKRYNVTVVIHCIHPQEFSKEFIRVAKLLMNSEIKVKSQIVLLKNINDNSEILQKLCLLCEENGIQPYQLHHLDQVTGTHHFRISIEKGLTIYNDLQKCLPAHSVPQYMLDLPNGRGKVPVQTLQKIDKNTYSVTSYFGEVVTYIDQFSS